MTRINLVPQSRLTDQHLLAEWRELPRVFSMPRPKVIPPTYRLGVGHVSYFWDKTGWLAWRHEWLTDELLSRGFKLTPRPLLFAIEGREECVFYGPDEYNASVARLREKLHNPPRPNFYTYRDEPVDRDWYGVGE